MSDTAYQTQYRQETIMGFEDREELLRKTTTIESEVNGNQAVFLVADSGGATAVTRGVNGDIPTRPDNLTQYTATLAEWHDVPERTRFNIFASQGDGRRIMQETSMAVINRKIKSDIYTALNTATVTWGSAAVATLTLIATAKTKLGNAFALDEEPFAAISPAMHGYMMTASTLQAAFANADYVSDKKFEGVSKGRAFSWYGVNWIVDGGVTGAGTSSADCLMYARSAIGHAVDVEGIDTAVGYDQKNDKSWCRMSTFMGSKVLQNAGIVKMTHDDSALS